MLLLGNILSFAGCLLMVAAGFIKKKDRVLLIQCVQFTLMGSGHLCLGASSGVVANIVSILRNLTFVKFKGTIWLKIFFVVLQFVMTLYTGLGEPISWIPLIAAVVYTWFLDLCGPIGFKVLNIGCQVLWCIYDLYFMNFAGFAFDVLSMITNFWGIVLIRKSMGKA